MKLTLYEVAKVVGAKNTISEFDDVPLRQIEFDSRKIEKGDLFLPLKGACNGHDFIETAFENGAVVDTQALIDAGLVNKCCDGIKILGNGKLTKSLTVKVGAYSEGAKQKIESAGGKAEVI